MENQMGCVYLSEAESSIMILSLCLNDMAF